MVNQTGMAASDPMGDGPPTKRPKFGDEGKIVFVLSSDMSRASAKYHCFAFGHRDTHYSFI